MPRRLLNLSLIALILLGAYRSWQSSQDRARLKKTHQILTRLTRTLPIADPSRVHILALETGDPLHFAWRIYVPQGYRYRIRPQWNKGMPAHKLDASEFTIRVRFRKNDRGGLSVYCNLNTDITWIYTFLDESVTPILENHLDRCQIEQLGTPEMAILDPDESATLFRITLPPDLASQARKILPSYRQKDVPVVFDLQVEPNPATYRQPTRNPASPGAPTPP